MQVVTATTAATFATSTIVVFDYDLADRVPVLGVAGGGVERRGHVVRLVGDIVSFFDLFLESFAD